LDSVLSNKVDMLHRFIGKSTAKGDLSLVGSSVVSALKAKHWNQKRSTWSVSSGSVVGDIAQTPPMECWGEATPHSGHSDGFPARIHDVIVKASEFVDITSLSPPDGSFEDAISDAIAEVAKQGRAVVFRLLFGNVPFSPVDCDDVLRRLTSKVPEGSKVKVWCAALRKDLTWNHSKIIAVDGRHLLQGGHNLWTEDYLKDNPVHDLSIELSGPVAVDAHLYVNRLWQSVAQYDATGHHCGPQWLETAGEVNVSVAQFPLQTRRLPPNYVAPKSTPQRESAEVSMITVGRLGALHRLPIGANPSDTAIAAMLSSARKSIRISQQDIGPMIHGCKMPWKESPYHVFGQVWPATYLRELGHALRRGVSINIVLSNFGNEKGGYSNGWTCADVAAEITKAVQQNGVNQLDDCELRDLVAQNLHVTSVHQKSGQTDYPDGKSISNHAKFVMVDDISYYIGSHNMYVAELAEWGVIVDDEDEARRVLNQYWWPMWEQSKFAECPVDDTIEALAVQRSGDPIDADKLVSK
jgi:phosphatidylserine/phosphatidylglycerophosphate/cardiolipin synthase-like enzyme